MNCYSEVVSLVDRAEIAFAGRNYQNALDTYTSAVKIVRELERSRLVAVLLNRMGYVLQAQGKIQDAVITYESALHALEKDTTLNLESVVNRLGQVGKGYSISDPEPLPDLYSATVAQTLEADENDPTLASKILLNIGNAYLQQPQAEPALNAYEQALQRPEIDTNPLLRAYAIANIGEIYRRQDKIDDAEVKLNQALQLFERYGNEPLEKRRAIALSAKIARKRGQIDRAIALYQQALALYQQSDDRLGTGRTYAGLANLYLQQKQFASAQHNYERAVELAAAEQDRDTLWYAYWGLGYCQHTAGELRAAIDSFQKSLALIDQRQQDLRMDEGKVAFLESVQDVFEQLLTVHLELAQTGGQDYSAALDVAEEARGQALQDLMEGRERQRPRIDTQAGLDNPGNMAVQAAPAIASNPRNIRVLATAANQQVEPSSPLARLVFYVLADRTAIFAVTPDGKVKGEVVPLGRDAIALRVTRLRRALNVDEVTRGVEMRKLTSVPAQVEPVEAPLVKLETLLQGLYAELVAPVADALPTDGTPVAVEPHCSLWLVPFAALRLPNSTWMGDRWSLIYAASAYTLEEIRQEPCYTPLANSKILAVGNPIMPTVPTHDGVEIVLQPLLGAEAEVKAIAQLFPEPQRTLLLGDRATEANVKLLAQSHNIVHLATHGIAYGDDPLASLVAFSPTEEENGLLTAREVMQTSSLPADLVVLSACQTGLGRISGEGMLGLCRAFLVAGARSVVVSQWSVSDRATMELMSAFYQHYLHSGNKAVALQQAMQTVRSQAEYSHPRYWASFIVVGAEE
jgi:CHAT domain-containing protein/tetratricopeptide (TPR) repeat protein